jgi:hypothetical protein
VVCEILVALKSRTSHILCLGGEAFEVAVSVGPALLRALEDNLDGTYTCLFDVDNTSSQNNSITATLMIIVTLRGKQIQGSPFKPMIIEIEV